VLGLLVSGIVGLFVLAVLGLVGAVISLVFGVVLLPFKLLGFAFRSAAVLLALPLLAVFGLLAFVIFGMGALLFLLPALPLVALVCGLIWLFRRRPHTVRA